MAESEHESEGEGTSGGTSGGGEVRDQDILLPMAEPEHESAGEGTSGGTSGGGHARDQDRLLPMAKSKHESAGEGTSRGTSSDGEVRDQNRLLPMANIERIMRRAFPGGARISQDAKELVQECATEFISYIASEASYKCRKEEDRKILTGNDILYSMKTFQLYYYEAILARYFELYRHWEEERGQIAIRDEDGVGEAGMTGGAAEGDNNPDGMEVEAEMAGSRMGGGQQNEDPNEAATGERQHQTTAGGGDEEDPDDWFNFDAFSRSRNESGKDVA